MKKLSSEIGELVKQADDLAERAGVLARMPGNTPETAAWLALYSRDATALLDRAPTMVRAWGASDAR